MTYRYLGHSLSDPRTTYRTPAEEKAWKDRDAISLFRAELVDAEVMSHRGA